MLFFELYNVTKEVLRDYNILCNSMRKPIIVILYFVVVYLIIDVLFYVLGKMNGNSIANKDPLDMYNGISIWTTITVKVIIECFFYTLFITSWTHMFEMSSMQTKLKFFKKIKEMYTEIIKCIAHMRWKCILNQCQIAISHSLHLPLAAFSWSVWTSLYVSYFNTLVHVIIWYIMIQRLKIHIICIPFNYRIEGKHIYKRINNKSSNVSAIIKWEYMDSKCENELSDTSRFVFEEDQDWDMLN